MMNVFLGATVMMGLLFGLGYAAECSTQDEGGAVLIYDVKNRDAVTETEMKNAVRFVSRLLSRMGIENANVRVVGTDGNQLEITIPAAPSKEIGEVVEQARKQLEESFAFMELMIVANDVDHRELVGAAIGSEKDEVVVERDDRTTQAGRWIQLSRNVDGKFVDVFNEAFVARNSKTFEPIRFRDIESEQEGETRALAASRLYGKDGIEILVKTESLEDCVNSNHLARVRSSFNEAAMPCVAFAMNEEGAERLSRLTRLNQPDNGRYRHLAIIIDDEVFMAPRINSVISRQGVIEGSFTAEEVADITAKLRNWTDVRLELEFTSVEYVDKLCS